MSGKRKLVSDDQPKGFCNSAVTCKLYVLPFFLRTVPAFFGVLHQQTIQSLLFFLSDSPSSGPQLADVNNEQMTREAKRISAVIPRLQCKLNLNTPELICSNCLSEHSGEKPRTKREKYTG